MSLAIFGTSGGMSPHRKSLTSTALYPAPPPPPANQTRLVQISKSHSVTQRATEQQENGVSDPCEYLADTLLPDSGFELIDHFDLQGGGFISL